MSFKSKASGALKPKSNTPLPSFLIQLYEIMDDVSNQPYIAWEPEGRSFLVKDYDAMQTTVLPKYFKHNNMQSFVRQLNMYNFKKIGVGEVREFANPQFIRGRRDLLATIKRKAQGGTAVEPSQQSQRVSTRHPRAAAGSGTTTSDNRNTSNDNKRKRVGGSKGGGTKKRAGQPPIGTYDIPISPGSIQIQRHDSFQEGLVPFGSFGMAGEVPVYPLHPLAQSSPDYGHHNGVGSISLNGSQGSFDSTYTPLLHMNSLSSNGGGYIGTSTGIGGTGYSHHSGISSTGSTAVANSNDHSQHTNYNNNEGTATTTTRGGGGGVSTTSPYDGQPLVNMSSIDRREFVNLMANSPRSTHHSPRTKTDPGGRSNNSTSEGSERNEGSGDGGNNQSAARVGTSGGTTTTINYAVQESDTTTHRRIRSLEARNLSLEARLQDLQGKHEALCGIMYTYLQNVGAYKGTPRGTPRGSQGGLSKENSVEKVGTQVSGGKGGTDKDGSRDGSKDGNAATSSDDTHNDGNSSNDVKGEKLDLRTRAGSIDTSTTTSTGSNNGTSGSGNNTIITSTPLTLTSDLNGSALQRIATLDPHTILTVPPGYAPAGEGGGKPPLASKSSPNKDKSRGSYGHVVRHGTSNHDSIATANHKSIAETALRMLRDSREERSPSKSAILAATALRKLLPLPPGVVGVYNRRRAGSEVLSAIDDATADAAELMISIASHPGQQMLAGQSIVKQQSLPASYRASK